MTDTQISEKPLSRGKAWILLAISFGISLAVVSFWIRGGWNLGLSLAITVGEVGLWLYSCGQNSPAGFLKPFSTSRRLFLIALTVAILFLGSTYYFYANEMLHVLNFLVLLVLIVVQAILLTGSSTHDWDEPLFWIEASLAPVVRPFVSLPRLGYLVKAAGTSGGTSDLVPGTKPEAATRPGRIFGQVLLGILLAVPVLLVAGSLLASADRVFSQVFSSIIDYWKGFVIKDRLADIGLALILFPFLFSFLESGRSGWTLVSAVSSSAPTTIDAHARLMSHREKTLRLNPVTLNAFLASINVLYILFAIIQVAYLTGAFRFVLPDGLTYAEYARNGFFELAAITPINVLLILLAVKGTGRQGLSGRILRVQSLLLIAGSFVQWLSAMFRMQMYIQIYDLTLLRFFVSAFMILMAVVLVLLIIKEFKPSFAFFKTAAIAALLSLVLLNAINVDTRIARFNIERAAADPTRTFDTNYLKELSPDVLLLLQESAPRFDPQQQIQIRSLISFIHTDYKLARENQKWQDLNWREQRFLRGIESGRYLD